MVESLCEGGTGPVIEGIGSPIDSYEPFSGVSSSSIKSAVVTGELPSRERRFEVELLRSTVTGDDAGMRIDVPEVEAFGLVAKGEVALDAGATECECSWSVSISSSSCSSSASKVVTLLNKEDRELCRRRPAMTEDDDRLRSMLELALCELL